MGLFYFKNFYLQMFVRHTVHHLLTVSDSSAELLVRFTIVLSLLFTSSRNLVSEEC